MTREGIPLRYVWAVALGLMLAGCSVFGLRVPPSQTPVSDVQAAKALELALEKIGAPYELAGRGPDTFDCSGLITWAYRGAVTDFALLFRGRLTDDNTMRQMWDENVIPLTADEVKPGDIVFITSKEGDITHGGLFIDWIDEETFEFVNASSFYDEVVIDDWPVHGTKREQWLVGFGRLLIAHR